MQGYYARLLPELVSSWRTLFDVRFTALVVQLAAWGNPDLSSDSRTHEASPALRHAQAQAVLNLSHAGLTLGIDIGDDARGKDAYPNPGHCHEFG